MKTAKEFVEYSLKFPPDSDVIIHMMKEFAKMHVEEALKAAIENAKVVEAGFVGTDYEEEQSSQFIYREGLNYSDEYFEVSPKSILNCYPIEKIQ